MAQEAEQPIDAVPANEPAPQPAVEAAPATETPKAEAAPEAPAEEAAAPAVAAPAPAVAKPVAEAAVPAVKVAPKKRAAKPAQKITATPVPAAPAPAKVVAKPVRAPAKAAATKLPAPARVARKVSAKPDMSAVVKPAPKTGLKAATPARASAIETPVTIKTKVAATPPRATFKETIMATQTFPTDFIATFSTAFSDMQSKAKTAYEKSTAALAEANDFAKGNVEAVVESGKILASGLQELSTSLVTESRTAFETMTAEVKDIAAVKSPNEFFSLQSALARKNFDTAMAQMTKNTEAMMKLATDAITPLSSRVSVAVEKVSKAA